ncbi:MAG: rod shape-determining protein RodA [Actinomycetota bacterium]
MMKAEGLFGQAVDRIGGEPISSRMARKAPIRHLDPVLLLTTLALSAFGAVMVYSATFSKQEAAGLDPALFLKRQIAYAVGGAIVLIVLTLFDYRHLKGLSIILYGLTAIILLIVLTPAGEVVGGARRWIDLGFVQIQPSEFAKIAVIVVVASFLAERKGEVGWTEILSVLGIVALPALLIFLEPDLGTMMVFVALTAALLMLGGVRWKHFMVLGIIAVIAVIAAVKLEVIHDYQIERVTAFMDPTPDLKSEGYNLTQSKIAIASGGLQGKGLGAEETQTALDFVPEQQTDFIFTAVGEQLGFVGSATLLALFAFLLWRALRIATMSRDLFGTLVAGGIITYWAFQIFVNVGMTMGIMPITGIPLPFISFGGSAMLTNYVAVALLLNIHMRRFL